MSIRRDSRNGKYYKPLSKHDEMVLENANAPRRDAWGARICSWLLLAGYLVFPSTFASLRSSQVIDDTGRAGKYIVNAVQNVPLLYIASFSCGLATAGLGWLWWKWSHNYVFLISRIIE